MSKVLVDPAALEEAAKWLEVHSSSSGSSEAFAAEALREAIAQPAEVEGSVEMGSDAWMALHLLDRLDVSADEEPRVQQVEEIVRRMGAALSAATAERDRLESMLIRTATRHFALQIKDRADDKKLDECLSEGIAMLEAERDRLARQVQRMIDQTTPLEPVPGDPMWSRRIQLDDVVTERDRLRAELEMLRDNNRKAAISDAAMAEKEA